MAIWTSEQKRALEQEIMDHEEDVTTPLGKELFLTLDNDLEDLRKAMALYYRKSPDLFFFRFYVLFFFLLFVVAAVFVAIIGAIEGSPCFIFMAVFFWFLSTLLSRQEATMIHEKNRKLSRSLPMSLRISDTELQLETDLTNERNKWPYYKCLYTTVIFDDTYLVIYARPNSVIVVPRRALGDQLSWQEFTDFISLKLRRHPASKWLTVRGVRIKT